MLFALFGAWGVMLFVGGFAGGIAHIFTFSHSADHMNHARARIVRGLFLAMGTLGLWEIVRVIAGEVPLSYLWLSLVLIAPAWVPWVYRLFAGKSGNGH